MKVVVTVGSSVIPFDRLVRAAGELAPVHDVLVQCGASKLRPSGTSCVDFLSFEELTGAVQAADVAVTHAGVGSVMLALSNGRRPVIIPRSAARGEAIDEHQADLAHRLAAAGLAHVVTDVAALGEAVEAARDSAAPTLRPTTLVDDVAAAISAAIAAPPRRRRLPLPRRWAA